MTTVIDNTTEPSNVELVPSVTATGSAGKVESYEIAPEDAHLRDAVLSIDPIHGVPTPHQMPEGWAHGLTFKLTALPPEMQAEVRQRLASVPADMREAKEAEFTAEAIRKQRGAIRIQTGVGSSASPYHREMVAVAREYSDGYDELQRLQRELDDVSGHSTKVDPATGKAEAVPIYRVQGPRRAAIEAEQFQILRRLSMLQNADGTPGPEGARRMKQALHESVQLLKQRQEAKAEMAEVERRSREQLREDRIAAQVASRVRMAKNAA